jgi:hypothetical protein
MIFIIQGKFKKSPKDLTITYCNFDKKKSSNGSKNRQNGNKLPHLVTLL